MPPVVKGFLCSVYVLCKNQLLPRPLDSFLSSLETRIDSNDRTEQPEGRRPCTHFRTRCLSDTRVSHLFR